jgi:hypothetical protein
MDIKQQHEMVKRAVKSFNKRHIFDCKDREFGKDKKEIIYTVTAQVKRVEYSSKKNSYQFFLEVDLNGQEEKSSSKYGMKNTVQICTINFFRSILRVYNIEDILFSWDINYEEDDYQLLDINENLDMFEKVKKFLVGRKIKVAGGKIVYKIEDMRQGKGYAILDYSIVNSPSLEDSHYNHDDILQMEMERWFDDYFSFPIKIVPHIVFPNAKTLGVPVSEQECDGAEDVGLLPLGGPRKKKKKQEAQEQTDSGSSGAVEVPTHQIIRRQLHKLKENEAFHHDVKAVDLEVKFNYKNFVNLVDDVLKYIPESTNRVHKMILELRSSRNPNWEAAVKYLLMMVDNHGMTVGPNWRITPQAELNEDELWDGFGDGANLEDFDGFADPVGKHTPHVDEETVSQLLADINEFYPECMPFIETWMNTHTDEAGEIDTHKFLTALVDYCSEMGIIIGPNWHVAPHPELNETEELEEATDYSSSSSGSYETPGIWATGKGKQSIKNSRAAKSKQFKKFLYGGPKATYVKNKNSVDTLDESSDIYKQSTDMKKSQIQQLVESTIKDEVLKALQEKPKSKTVVVKEDTFLKAVDSIISEEKHPAQSQFEKIHKESGKLNKKSNSDTEKEMNAYGKFEGNDNPEFPKAISKPTVKKGEDGEAKRRKNSDDEQEFVDDFKGKSLEDLMYDLEPDAEFKKRAKMSLDGDSLMGNASGKDTANTIETDTSEKMQKKAKRRAKKEADAPMYNKDVQPTGKKSDKNDLKGSALSESVENEMAKIKKLFTYSGKTQ